MSARPDCMHDAVIDAPSLTLYYYYNRIQREYFKQQEASGKLTLSPPSPKKLGKSLVDQVGIPSHVTQVMSDAESALTTTISKSIYQTSNPGYIVRDGSKLAGTTHKDYVYDEEEIAYMKDQVGPLINHHPRDPADSLATLI